MQKYQLHLIKQYQKHTARNISHVRSRVQNFRPDTQKLCQMENAVRDI